MEASCRCCAPVALAAWEPEGAGLKILDQPGKCSESFSQGRGRKEGKGKEERKEKRKRGKNGGKGRSWEEDKMST